MHLVCNIEFFIFLTNVAMWHRWLAETDVHIVGGSMPTVAGGQWRPHSANTQETVSCIMQNFSTLFRIRSCQKTQVLVKMLLKC